MADTSVPQPVFGPNGFVAPSEADILIGVQADIDGAFGGGLNPALSTPQGQLATSQTAIIGDSYSMFIWFCNQVDPAYSSGRMQDGIGRIYFIERFPARGTAVIATCSGREGTPIPVGALARATDNNIYVCTERGTIPASGSIDLTFQCTVAGPISCAAGNLNTIYQTIFGWDSITNVDDGVLGRLVESRSEFEERRRLSVGLNSMGPLGAILGAVLSIDNVLDAIAIDNPAHSATVVGGIILGPHSIYVAAIGGNTDDIAFAIWQHKMPGCGYNGNTSVIVDDPNPQYNAPPPSYLVQFQRPATVDFAVLVTLFYNASIPDDALTQIQAAIISAFAGADGGPRAKIGSTIFASRYYSTVMALGEWAQQIISIQVGINEDCLFTGSITGTQLTVSAVAKGLLTAGGLLQGSGIETGTTVISQISGITGKTGVYNISTVHSIGSEAMSCTTMLDDVSVTINQAPSVASENIALAVR